MRVALRLWSLERLFVLIVIGCVVAVRVVDAVVTDSTNNGVGFLNVLGKERDALITNLYVQYCKVREHTDFSRDVFCKYTMKCDVCHAGWWGVVVAHVFTLLSCVGCWG